MLWLPLTLRPPLHVRVCVCSITKKCKRQRKKKINEQRQRSLNSVVGSMLAQFLLQRQRQRLRRWQNTLRSFFLFCTYCTCGCCCCFLVVAVFIHFISRRFSWRFLVVVVVFICVPFALLRCVESVSVSCTHTHIQTHTDSRERELVSLYLLALF